MSPGPKVPQSLSPHPWHYLRILINVTILYSCLLFSFLQEWQGQLTANKKPHTSKRGGHIMQASLPFAEPRRGKWLGYCLI